MHRYKYKKHKQEKQIEDRFVNDPVDAKCPHCGKIKRACSHVDGLSRAWARWACKKKQGR